VRKTAAIAVRAGLALGAAAAGARADVNTLVEWQVSPDNVHWTNTLIAQPGNLVFVRVRMSYIGAQAPVAFASLVFQPTVSNWDAQGPQTDTLAPFVNGGAGSNTSTPIGVVTNPADPTQFGRLSPFGRSALSSTSHLMGHVHTGGSGGAPQGSWLRIAQAQITNWIGQGGNTTGGSGVPLGQLMFVCRCTDPGPSLETQNVTMFKFGVHLSSDAAPRLLRIDSPPSAFGNRNTATGEREVYWYADWNESTGSIRGTPQVIPASIRVGQCGSPDFNHDGDVGDSADVEAFFECLAGKCCATCDSADVDGDGDTGTDADIEAFFRILAGGSC
jgi:hypothetical protein